VRCQCQCPFHTLTKARRIITKPDYLREGSDNEKDWISLALNEDIYFELGWHMLKNRADDKHDSSFDERNKSELHFFSKGRYNDLPRTMVGIESLRSRLSTLLNNHLGQELPHLKKELERKLEDTVKDLKNLGDKRSTVVEQKQYLMQLSVKGHDVLKSAVSGHYENSFFGTVDTESSVDSSANLCGLRAVIQFLNLSFAENMRRYGHKHQISKKTGADENIAGLLSLPVKSPLPCGDDSDKDVDAGETANNPPAEDLGLVVPKKLNREEGLQWVLRVLQRSRGRELPGNFNPMLISQLFWEQSEP